MFRFTVTQSKKIIENDDGSTNNLRSDDMLELSLTG